jgi:hypothetical protein
MTMVRKLVYAFYTKEFSFGRFVKTYPQYKNTIIDLLVGDVFRPEVEAVFKPMSAMAPIPETIPLEKPGRGEGRPEGRDKGTGGQGDKEMAGATGAG